MRLVDCHVHLPAYPEEGLHDLLAGAAERKIRIFSMSISLREAGLNQSLRAWNPSMISSFAGIHPSEALSADEGQIPAIMDLWQRSDGIGEIGLDPKYSPITLGSAQMRIFTTQLALAERLRKPVEVHSRGAERECIEILGSFDLPRVLMHWYENEELLPKVIDAGYYVSVGPALTYSKKLSRIAARVPRGRIMTESDGPTPFSPLRGTSGPGLVPSVVFRLAEILGLTFDEVAFLVAQNASAFMPEAPQGLWHSNL